MARSARDCALLLAAIAGADPKDSTALLESLPDYAGLADQGVKGFRIGVDPTWNSDDVDPTVQAALSQAVEVFRALGATDVSPANSSG